jgi:hypothetical protein
LLLVYEHGNYEVLLQSPASVSIDTTLKYCGDKANIYYSENKHNRSGNDEPVINLLYKLYVRVQVATELAVL